MIWLPRDILEVLNGFRGLKSHGKHYICLRGVPKLLNLASLRARWGEIYGTGLERAKASKLGVFIHNVFDASQDFWKMSKIGVSLSGDYLGENVTIFCSKVEYPVAG